MALDVKQMNRNDQIIAGAGVVMLILSFLAWYTVKVEGLGSLGGEGSLNGWDLDFLGATLAVILSLLAAGFVVARAAGTDTSAIKAPAHVVTLALAGGAVVMMLLQWLRAPDVPDVPGLDAGFTVVFYLALLMTVLQAVFAFLSFQAAGGMNAAPGSSAGTGDGTSGFAAPPTPPTGYDAPQPPAAPPGGTNYPPPAE